MRSSASPRSGTTPRQALAVVADFAEIDGRLECVGLGLRSYIRHETRVITGKVDGQDAWVTYDAFWTGESLVAPEPRTDEKIDWDGRRDVPWHDLARHDLLAVQAQAQDDPAMFSPRPLRTETLRDLPLGRQLQEARGVRSARRIGRLAEAISDLHLAAQREAGNTGGSAAARAVQGGTDRGSRLHRRRVKEARPAAQVRSPDARGGGPGSTARPTAAARLGPPGTSRRPWGWARAASRPSWS